MTTQHPIRKKNHDFRKFLLITISITVLTGGLLYWLAPVAYAWLGHKTFLLADTNHGEFDAPSYIGMLQIIFGMPIALAGSVYAIYLARQSIELSSFNNNQVATQNRQALSHEYIAHLSEASAAFHRLALALRRLNYSCSSAYSLVDIAIQYKENKEKGEYLHLESLSGLTEAKELVKSALLEVSSAIETIYSQSHLQTCLTTQLQSNPNSLLSYVRNTYLMNEDWENQPLLTAIVNFDYLAIADALAARATSLSEQDIALAVAESNQYLILRWASSEANQEMHPSCMIESMHYTNQDIAAYITDSHTDEFGLRFFGYRLLKHDVVLENGNAFTIDVATSLFLDLFNSLPNQESIFASVNKHFHALTRDLKALEAQDPDLSNYKVHIIDPNNSISSSLKEISQHALITSKNINSRTSIVRRAQTGKSFHYINKYICDLLAGAYISKKQVFEAYWYANMDILFSLEQSHNTSVENENWTLAKKVLGQCIQEFRKNEQQTANES